MTDDRKRQIISDVHSLASLVAGCRRTVKRSLADDDTVTEEDIRSHTMAVFIAVCDRYELKRGGVLPNFAPAPAQLEDSDSEHDAID